MEDNRLFSEIGKKTPYQVPEGYFEQSKQRLQTIDKASAPMSSRTRPTQRLIRWSYTVVASMVILLGIVALMRLTLPTSSNLTFSFHNPSSDPSYTLITDAPLYSSQETEDWTDFADADIFLDNLEW